MPVASPRTSCSRCGTTLSRTNTDTLCSPCRRSVGATGTAQHATSSRGDGQVHWLSAEGERSAPPDGSNLAAVLKAYRSLHQLKQQDLADLLGYDQSYVSLLERGKRTIRDMDELRRLAQVLALPEDELGLLPAVDAAVATNIDSPKHGGPNPLDAVEDQRRWRMTRRELNRHRSDLTAAAARLYPDVERAGNSTALTKPSWMWPSPVDFADVELTWLTQPTPPQVLGNEPEAAGVRPLAPRGGRFDRYSQAIRVIDRPSLFVNRPSFRLLDVAQVDGRPKLSFGYTTYFDMADVCEGVAHELAKAWLETGSDAAWMHAPEWDPLPLRTLVGDPFDLARRPLLPSIDTLTIRLGPEGASFPLHHRSASNVALAGGIYHIMPAGVFQPSSIMPWDQSNDFNLWRNVLREYAEEFLGDPEADGSSGEPIDYDGTEPFRSLNEARREGKVRPYCFGIGLDPLTLAGEILSVVVIDSEVYDSVFADMVSRNSEGTVIAGRTGEDTAGIEFTEANIRRLLDNEPLASAAAACLDLAWQHRGLILG
ncbi:helix-turn-helix transcriptional regulator [Streptomyces sp. H10-C2]|uniref:helix-turn-helix domain-containing protein n=1 Tax=unclassified Streptomyces TaxID=2593676 RepID=UPI0024B9C267|nr:MULTISPECIES: helix-turn-helix transcriptional regulator [unclassified Streptomyces]MDJ0341370.1 helix-turn-helix transcriptional regulator [Streptomyces sp. PH10-H1]MDJ0370965.1 helix-turn-helix transcriptional regulator [Streptomyces sp. H10-C2]